MGMESSHFVVYAGVQINKQSHDEDQDNQIWFIFLSEDVCSIYSIGLYKEVL